MYPNIYNENGYLNCDIAFDELIEKFDNLNLIPSSALLFVPRVPSIILNRRKEEKTRKFGHCVLGIVQQEFDRIVEECRALKELNPELDPPILLLIHCHDDEKVFKPKNSSGNTKLAINKD